jgi:serine/threonine protein phosphatase PrpC
MSRSFGDRVAASVGVIAEPEIFEYKFQEDDKFMIVASDGVWEFIESPEVIFLFYKVCEYYQRILYKK